MRKGRGPAFGWGLFFVTNAGAVMLTLTTGAVRREQTMRSGKTRPGSYRKFLRSPSLQRSEPVARSESARMSGGTEAARMPRHRLTTCGTGDSAQKVELEDLGRPHRSRTILDRCKVARERVGSSLAGGMALPAPSGRLSVRPMAAVPAALLSPRRNRATACLRPSSWVQGYPATWVRNLTRGDGGGSAVLRCPVRRCRCWS